MAQSKSDRQAAGKKAAATRQRKDTKAKSQAAGKKGASTRQRGEAAEQAQLAGLSAGAAVAGLISAGKVAGGAAIKAGKSVASRVGAMKGGKR